MSTTLTKRVAALEAKKSPATTEANIREAYRRLWDALALPTQLEQSHGVQTAPAGFTLVVDVPAVKLDDLVPPLHDRIEAGAMTDADRAVLAALPVDDLRVAFADEEPGDDIDMAIRFIAGVARCFTSDRV